MYMDQSQDTWLDELLSQAKQAHEQEREAIVAELLGPYLERRPTDDYAWFLFGDSLRVIGDPMNCAGRELLEETGYLAGNIKPLRNFYASPGIMTEKMYGFLATKLTKQTTQLDEGEEIELQPMKFDACIEAIRTGQIVDSKTISTLLIYDRFVRGRK